MIKVMSAAGRYFYITLLSVFYRISDNICKIKANKSVIITKINALELGKYSLELGAGKKNIDDKVTVAYKDLKGLNGYAKAGFKEGDIVTYEDLLYALMLPSGADAAQALAYHTTGNPTSFVELMNKELFIKIKLELKH